MNRRLPVIIVLGGVLGTAADMIHTASGALYYPAPAFLGEASWVPPFFAAVALVACLGHRLTRRVLGGRGAGEGLFAAGAWFFGAYGATGLLHRWPVALLALLLATFALRVALEPGLRTRAGAAFTLSMALVGPAYEVWFTAQGAFFYAHPDVLGIALWLPGLYLHAAPFIGALDRWWETGNVRPVA
jgi:hypothetical protein